ESVIKFAPAGILLPVVAGRPSAICHGCKSATVKIHYVSHEFTAAPAEREVEKLAFRVTIHCSHQARVVTAYIEKERRRHQLGIAHVKIFVLIQTLEPGTVSDGILVVVVAKLLGNVFTLEAAGHKVRNVVGSVRTKIQTRTVKRIDESGGVAHHRSTVVANFFAMIRQHRERVHIAFDHFCCAEDFAPDGIVQDVCVQSLSQSRSLWKFEDATVVNDTGADIAALQ